MEMEVPGMRSSSRRGKGEAGAHPVPVSLYSHSAPFSAFLKPF
jgi:hypothetical protein